MVGDTARGVLGRLCELSPGKMLTATPCRVRSRGVSALLLTFATPLFLTHTELSLFVEKFRGLNNDSTSASPTVESFGTTASLTFGTTIAAGFPASYPFIHNLYPGVWQPGHSRLSSTYYYTSKLR